MGWRKSIKALKIHSPGLKAARATFAHVCITFALLVTRHKTLYNDFNQAAGFVLFLVVLFHFEFLQIGQCD